MLKLVGNLNSAGKLEFPLEPGNNFAGRGFANDMKIEDPSVSSNHAQIIVEGGRVIIRDLNSKNGTFINGLPVTEAELMPGQSVRLGAVELVVEVERPKPEIIDGIPIANPVVAEALRAARERNSKKKT